MNLRHVDWIWHVRGSLPLASGQSSDDAFDRLDPLFRQPGTSHRRTNDTLAFSKKDPAAQDKMSVFDDGVLRIEHGVAGSVLHYRLMSRILLFCFLAPLLFLSFAGLTILAGKLESPPTAAEKAAEAKKKAAKKSSVAMNPIDKALGAPAPDTPDKKKAKKAEDEDKKPSPTPAYVLAAMFAALYALGRVLEARLVKTLFSKALLGPRPS